MEIMCQLISKGYKGDMGQCRALKIGERGTSGGALDQQKKHQQRPEPEASQPQTRSAGPDFSHFTVTGPA